MRFHFRHIVAIGVPEGKAFQAKLDARALAINRADNVQEAGNLVNSCLCLWLFSYVSL